MNAGLPNELDTIKRSQISKSRHSTKDYRSLAEIKTQIEDSHTSITIFGALAQPRHSVLFAVLGVVA